MLPYILECIAFQLVFLIIYDFFLKRETFFQWNRAYLIGTYSLSLILPWIKIDAFRTAVPETFNGYSELLWNLDQKPVLLNAEVSHGFSLSWQEWIFVSGVLLASVWFILKIYRLYRLKRNGTIQYFKDFTQILVPESYVAFSFFKSIFLGDQLAKKEYDAIISHEMVHIKQRHSLDLLFFELMRIMGWFNPLVYVYQNRIAELHEFIADSKVPKTERAAHYELLLLQVFETQNISFVNQFFKSSLIKKRIVMLQKSKSKKVWQLKYLLLVPVLLGMLGYTSMESGVAHTMYNNINETAVKSFAAQQEPIPFAEVENVPVFPGCENDADKRGCFFENMRKHIRKNFNYPEAAKEKGIQGRVNTMFVIDEMGVISNLKMRGPDSLLTNEAKRIIDRLPIMKPGMHKDKAVKVAFSIPISFKSNENGSAASNKQETIDYDGALDVPFAVIEEVPIFPGCENAADKKACFNAMMQNHISKNFNYPQEAQDKGIQGRVNIIFTIQKDGTIGNVRMRGPDKLLEKEAARIIKKLPKMTAGKQKGKKVNVPFSIPISFQLAPNEPNAEPGIAVHETEHGVGLSFSDKPLYLVDGVEATMDYVRALNPDDIATVNVFKNKVALDKYGEKGKYGVVEITTKKKN
ncbi:TonB family protein [Maribacter sp. R77961]|uniref:TonB family protein n=1 Tax=Maribacter sp. R77961 TaxID=3093871 RepID=UPI0037C93729